jgi:hypothetical protein
MTYLYFKTLMTLSRSAENKFPSGGLICRLEDDLVTKIGLRKVRNLIEVWLDITIP